MVVSLSGAIVNPLLPGVWDAFGWVVGLLMLGLVLVAVIAVMRSGHTVGAKAAMLLLAFLVPVIGAIFALLLARQEPDGLRLDD
ncbi:PLDc N-terminal domain-containing protein [Nesterenkonia alkaliphila]|uniref:Cardiolipin synthase N-terminal domain-containing protein n=1 Tax=Nesterenkonia alkaliphila TaxID=1463631 RepID=A0A7K1UHP4_9MICC|nr:PLDc N-terminal domain-containing protein [Nesterenkonia alkaliphila]MVT25990.1 hypothetical protein [Nesterenkonia alkaliphila]GFZ96171.1 hypothetical protein GCM10011359_27010 [Nesterenkonia alkaliphila]